MGKFFASGQAEPPPNRDAAIATLWQLLNATLTLQRFRSIESANPQLSFQDDSGLVSIVWKEGGVECGLSMRSQRISLTIACADHQSLNQTRKSLGVCLRLPYLDLPVSFDMPSPADGPDFVGSFGAALEQRLVETIACIKREIAEFQKIL